MDRHREFNSLVVFDIPTTTPNNVVQAKLSTHFQRHDVSGGTRVESIRPDAVVAGSFIVSFEPGNNVAARILEKDEKIHQIQFDESGDKVQVRVQLYWPEETSESYLGDDSGVGRQQMAGQQEFHGRVSSDSQYRQTSGINESQGHQPGNDERGEYQPCHSDFNAANYSLFSTYESTDAKTLTMDDSPMEAMPLRGNYEDTTLPSQQPAPIGRPSPGKAVPVQHGYVEPDRKLMEFPSTTDPQAQFGNMPQSQLNLQRQKQHEWEQQQQQLQWKQQQWEMYMYYVQYQQSLQQKGQQWQSQQPSHKPSFYPDQAPPTYEQSTGTWCDPANQNMPMYDAQPGVWSQLPQSSQAWPSTSTQGQDPTVKTPAKQYPVSAESTVKFSGDQVQDHTQQPRDIPLDVRRKMPLDDDDGDDIMNWKQSQITDKGKTHLDPCSLKVTGFKPGTTAENLVLYFESKKKSRGGPVDSHELKDGTFFVTFEEAGDAESVLNHHDHVLNGVKLSVTQSIKPVKVEPHIQPIPEKGNTHIDPNCSLKVTGFNPGTPGDSLVLYFESKKKSKGGPVENIRMTDDKTFVVTFENTEDAKSVLDHRSHVYNGAKLTVKPFIIPVKSKRQLPTAPNEATTYTQVHSLEVTGFKPGTSLETLSMYFESKKKSKGGVVKGFGMKDNKTFIVTFEDTEVARSVLNYQSHVLNGACLTVTPYMAPMKAKQPLPPGPSEESPKYDPFTLEVTGFTPGTGLDTLELYFESKKKSKGGPVKKHKMKDDKTFVVTFENAEDVASVLSQKDHILNGTKLTVKPCKLPVKHSKQLPFSHDLPQYDPFSIEVTGFKPGTAVDTLEMYFESKKRSNGGAVKLCKMANEKTAIVTFEKVEAAENVLRQKKHVLNEASLTVKQFRYDVGKKEQYMADEGKQSDSEEEESNCTIEVTGFKPDTSTDTLELYFESKKSGGGPIVESKLNNGVFTVTFETRDVCERVLQKTKLAVGGTTLSVREPAKKKRKPKLPRDMTSFLLKGLADGTSRENLELYLENCTGIDNQTPELFFGEEPGTVMVKYSEEIQDFGKIFEKMSKKKLNKVMLTAEPVYLTNCIIVSNLPKHVSEDTVQLYFESTKRSGGGEVQDVEIDMERKAAFVFFKDYTVVDAVLKRKHLINKTEVEVQPYMECLGHVVSREEPTARIPDPFTFSVIPNVMHFIESKQNLKGTLDQIAMTAYAKLKWPCEGKEDDTILVIPNIPQEMENQYQVVRYWSKTVKEALDGYLGNFITGEVPVAEGIWLQVISQKSGWVTEDVDVLEDDLSSPSVIQVTGRIENVNIVQAKLQSLIKDIKDDMQKAKLMIKESTHMDKFKIKQLLMIKFSRTVEDKFKDFDMKIIPKSSQVIFEGLPRDITEAKCLMYETLDQVPILKYRASSKHIHEFLKTPSVCSAIHDMFKQQQVQATYLVEEEEIKCSAVSSKDVQKAVEIMRSNVVEDSLPIQLQCEEAIGKTEWNDLVTQLQEEHTVSIGLVHQHGKLSVLVTGFKRSISTIMTEVEDFIKVNTIVEHSIKMESGKAKYIFDFRKHDVDNIQQQASRMPLKITHLQKGPSVMMVVKGAEDDVKAGLQQLHKLSESVFGRPHIVEKPGMAKLFREDKGQNYLRMVEGSHNCRIDVNDPSEIIMTSEPEDDDFEDVEPTAPPITYDILCFHTLGDGRRIVVGKGDLTKMHVDAIVNSANQTLNHSTGGLTTAISDAGGRSIQKETAELIKKSGGRIFEGQAVYTGPGNLPCKMIIHAVAPRWNKKYGDHSEVYGQPRSQEERLLADVVINSLKLAERMGHTSIAFPAIGSGAFGFPLDLCVKTIVDAIDRYCGNTRPQSIMEIRLVDNSVNTCNKFKDAMVQHFGEKKVTVTRGEDKGALPPQEEWHTVSTSSRRHRRGAHHITSEEVGDPVGATGGVTLSSDHLEIITPEQKKIRLVKGSIAHQRANVIVNTTQTTLDLNTGGVSMALLKVAGQQLQQEVNLQKTRVSTNEGDIVITGGGGLQCVKVYHVLCCKWDGGRKSEQLLRGIMRKCFDTADQGHVTSIVFPAVGTGGLGFPRNFTARVMYEEAMAFSRKNPRGSVSDIRFVVYDKDMPTIKAFEDEISKLSGTRMSSTKRHKKMQPNYSESHSHSQHYGGGGAAAADSSASYPSDGDSLYTDLKKGKSSWQIMVGGIKVQLQQGDITVETTDAIVNSTNEELNLNMGGVSKAILQKGGNRIQTDCKRYAPQPFGSVVVTSSGKLKCRKILHLVSSPKNIKDDIMNILQVAEQNGIRSIALPAIGTGGLGVSSKVFAATTLKVIGDFFQTYNPKSLNLVKVTIFQPGLVSDFQQAMENVLSMPMKNTKGGLSKFIGAMSSVGTAISSYFGSYTSGKGDGKTSTDKVVLYIFAGSVSDIEGAISRIEKLIEDEFIDLVIDKESVGKVSDEEVADLAMRAERLHVKLDKVDTGSVARLRLQGAPQSVMKVQKEVDTLLDRISEEERRISEAKMLARNVKWLYLNDQETYEEYEDEVMGLIEKAYLEDKKAITVIIEGGNYKIDFTNMTEMDLDDRSTVSVRRELKESGFSLPNHWRKMADDDQLKRVKLDATSTEYTTVATTFMQSLQPHNVVQQIERIQNPKLYRQYMVLKQNMDRKNKKGINNEKLLYHGTGVDSVDKINHGGFNRSFAGKNATVYGAGSYFAVNSSYSASTTYSPPDPTTGNRYVYQAKVLTGEFTRGQQGMLVPPSKSGSDPTDCYDSVTDNVRNPSLFVVFNDAMAYPDYLITFR
ncbi:protein mono-ADP-ribosyltransferase PARP14-like isoform X2 [Glandiceps talaboti]